MTARRMLALSIMLLAIGGSAWWLKHRPAPPVAPVPDAPINDMTIGNIAIDDLAPDRTAAPALSESTPSAPAPVRLEATLAGAYRASSAKAALSALASAPPSSETRAIESALERLCLRVTDGSEPAPPAAASSEIAPSFRAQQRALLDQYCADIDRAEGSRADLERALDALGEDSFLSLQKALKAEPTPALAYQLARRTLANSPDELSMSAAAMFLDLAGELGVPPHSVDRDHPAQLGELVADVVGWVRCSELNGCGPRMAPVLSLCMNQNHCPPDADYATALRLSLSESRWEQAQWLYAQLRAARAAGARP